LEDLPNPDPEDAIDQAIEPLESLEEGLSDLLKGLKEIK
jgi:hypothetical protein